MPKSKKDFQKSKVKVGRHLTKGSNITKIAFKTKKIAIKSAFNKDNNLDDKQLLDVCNKMDHYPTKMKLQLMTKLGDVIKNADEFERHSTIIIQTHFKMLGNAEKPIRESACRNLKLIMEEIRRNDLTTSFLRLFESNIVLLSSHFIFNIRKDVLEFALLFLETLPDICCKSDKFLTACMNFLTEYALVSQVKKDVNLASTSKQEAKVFNAFPASFSRTYPKLTVRRKLFVSPVANYCTEKWRIQVLNCLRQFLKAKVGLVISKSHYEFYKDDDLEVKPPWVYTPTLCPKRDLMLPFLAEFLPLLSDIFEEETACLNTKFGASCLIKVATASRLKTIFKILSLLENWLYCFAEDEWEARDILNWLRKECRETMSKFIRYFPYVINASGYNEPTHHKECIDIDLNLTVYSIYVAFLHDSHPTVVFDVLTRYMVNLVEESSINYDPNIIINISRKMLMEKKDLHAEWLRLYEISTKDFLSISDKQKVTPFLCQLSVDGHYIQHFFSKPCVLWQNRVIDEMKEMIYYHKHDSMLLLCVRTLCLRQPAGFKDTLQMNVDFVLEHLTAKNEIVQKTVTFMAFCMPDLTPDYLNALAKRLCHPSIKKENVVRIFTEFLSRLEKLSSIPRKFVKFVFDIITGDCCSVKEVGENQICDKKIYNFPMKWKNIRILSKYNILPSCVLERSSYVAENLFKILLTSYNIEKVFKFASEYYEQFLDEGIEQGFAIPQHCALALLVGYEQLNRKEVAKHLHRFCLDTKTCENLFELGFSSGLVAFIAGDSDRKFWLNNCGFFKMMLTEDGYTLKTLMKLEEFVQENKEFHLDILEVISSFMAFIYERHLVDQRAAQHFYPLLKFLTTRYPEYFPRNEPEMQTYIFPL